MKTNISRYNIFESNKTDNNISIDLKGSDAFKDYIKNNLENATLIVLQQIVVNIEQFLQEYGYEVLSNNVELSGHYNIYGFIVFKDATDTTYCLKINNPGWIDLYDVTTVVKEPFNLNQITYDMMKQKNDLELDVWLTTPNDIIKSINKYKK